MPTVFYGTVRGYQSVPGARGAVRRPVLAVRLVHRGVATPESLALGDSGADRSTFHVDVALLAGTDLGRCRAEQAQGIGGVAVTSVCAVELELEGRRFAADVHFTTMIFPTLALLGRRDVFQQFRFGFDERAMELLVAPYA